MKLILARVSGDVMKVCMDSIKIQMYKDDCMWVECCITIDMGKGFVYLWMAKDW